MTATHTRTTSVTAVVGAAIAGIAAPALLFLGTGTAHAIQDVSERTSRDWGSFVNPVPEPPSHPDPGSQSPTIGNPNDAGVGNPNEGQIGGPDTKVRVGTPRGSSPSLNPGDAERKPSSTAESVCRRTLSATICRRRLRRVYGR
jgi:hypothetical protein